MLMRNTRFPLGGREGGSKSGPRSEPIFFHEVRRNPAAAPCRRITPASKTSRQKGPGQGGAPCWTNDLDQAIFAGFAHCGCDMAAWRSPAEPDNPIRPQSVCGVCKQSATDRWPRHEAGGSLPWGRKGDLTQCVAGSQPSNEIMLLNYTSGKFIRTQPATP
jgi:hypothetical protein